MSTLRDLRDTLDEHADRLDDTERYARIAAVRARVRVVRRRRTAATAVAAAVAVVATVTAVGSLRGPGEVEPAGPSVIGIDVPEDVTVGGFGYAFSDAHDLTDTLRVRLPASDREQVVSLVSEGLGDGSATLRINGNPHARSFAGEPVEVAVPAYTAIDSDIRIWLDGTPAGARVGIAVYDRTDDLPAGVDDGTRVFREQVAGSHLLTAAFSEPGEDLELPFEEGDHGPLEYADFCTTSAAGVWMTLVVDGQDHYSTTCRENETVDAGIARNPLGRLSGRHTLSIRLTQGNNGPEIRPDDAVVGLAVYAAAQRGGSPGRVLGTTPARYVEWEGRTWRYVGSEFANAPHDRFRGIWSTDDQDALVAFVANSEQPVQAEWSGRLDRGTSDSSDAPGRSVSMIAGTLLEGDDYTVTVRSLGGAPFRGGLVWYEPVAPADAW